MQKPMNLQKGDKVAIVSLSLGLLGEEGAKHELDLGIKRLREFGLEPVIMPNALKGIKYLANHPEARAEDLKLAFKDDSIKGIITAIGGDDTYKLIPYLMEDEEFRKNVLKNPKLFTGFSDTTNNHLLFYRLGLRTFYGPCFLVDLAELDKEMLPYTKEYFKKYFLNESSFEIKSSPIWYIDRENFDESQLGIPRKKMNEAHGYEILQGKGKVSGTLYGGCIESLYDDYVGMSYPDMPDIMKKYHILLEGDELKDKILFLETSELMIEPDNLYKMLMVFKEHHMFDLINGMIIGKPRDEKYYEEYKDVYKKIFDNSNIPILYNVNFGHAYPRCIIPYGAKATIDYDLGRIYIDEAIFERSEKVLSKHI